MIIDFKDAFSDRPNDAAVNLGHIQRIITAYNLAKRDQLDAGSVYQVGNEWQPIYTRYMQESMTALSTCDTEKVNALFSNFFREALSTGLHGLHFDMVDRYMTPGKPIQQRDADIYMEMATSCLNLFLRNCPNVPINALVRPTIGNPYGYRLDDLFINMGADLHFYTAQKVGMLLHKVNKPAVLELGGGYGGMAYFLLRDNAGLTYIDMDLPENAALAAYYLLTAFPDKKIALYGEVDIGTEDLSKFDAIILPNFEIQRLKPNSIDLSFNAYSLAEMSPETIANYVKIICDVTRNHFYHINHAVHSLVSADQFAVDADKFFLLFRIPCMWGKTKDRNPDIDEHEYVYVAKGS